MNGEERCAGGPRLARAVRLCAFAVPPCLRVESRCARSRECRSLDTLRSLGMTASAKPSIPHGTIGSGRCEHAVGPMSRRTMRWQRVTHDRAHHDFRHEPAPEQLRREGGCPRRRRPLRAGATPIRSADRCGLPAPRRGALHATAPHRRARRERRRPSRTEWIAGEPTRQTSGVGSRSYRASVASRAICTLPLIAHARRTGVHQGLMEGVSR